MKFQYLIYTIIAISIFLLGVSNLANAEIYYGMGSYTIVPGIKGMVYNDLNKNGFCDYWEKGIPGATIKLYKNNIMLGQKVTDNNGFYYFSNLDPIGNYTVIEASIPAGYISVHPKSYTVHLIEYQNYGPPLKWVYDIRFANIPANSTSTKPPGNGIIKGILFNDLNKNGKKDTNEPGITGTTIQLLDVSGKVVYTRVTNHSGYFDFTYLAPGTYTVKEVLQSNVKATTPISRTVTVNTNSTIGTTFGNTY